MSSILYAGLYQGSSPITEYDKGNPQSRKFALAIATQAEPGTKLSFTLDHLSGHYMIRSNGNSIVVVTEANVPRRAAFSLLQSLDQGLSPSDIKVNKAKIREIVDNFDVEASDSIGQAQQDIAEIRNVMIENIDKLLQRGERVSLLVDRTHDMNTSANLFKRKASQVRSRFWWRNFQMILLLVALVIGFILLYEFA